MIYKQTQIIHFIFENEQTFNILEFILKYN